MTGLAERLEGLVTEALAQALYMAPFDAPPLATERALVIGGLEQFVPLLAL